MILQTPGSNDMIVDKTATKNEEEELKFEKLIMFFNI